MTPYYDDGDGRVIYFGDNRDVLPQLEQRATVILTDPPFFMPVTHYQSRTHWQRRWGDTSILSAFYDAFLASVMPRLIDTGHMFAFCNHESFPVFYPLMYNHFDFLKSIIWDKKHIGLGKVWRNQHELIIAARWNTSIFYEDGLVRADVLTYPVIPHGERDHPVMKPIPLLTDLLSITTTAGQLVLDPFMGSGTTLRAAKEIGRKAIGIEIEERYCEIAARRLSQEVLPLAYHTTPTIIPAVKTLSLFGKESAPCQR